MSDSPILRCDCGARLAIPAKLFGLTIHCPGCGSTLDVPDYGAGVSATAGAPEAVEALEATRDLPAVAEMRTREPAPGPEASPPQPRPEPGAAEPPRPSPPPAPVPAARSAIMVHATTPMQPLPPTVVPQVPDAPRVPASAPGGGRNGRIPTPTMPGTAVPEMAEPAAARVAAARPAAPAVARPVRVDPPEAVASAQEVSRSLTPTIPHAAIVLPPEVAITAPVPIPGGAAASAHPASRAPSKGAPRAASAARPSATRVLSGGMSVLWLAAMAVALARVVALLVRGAGLPVGEREAMGASAMVGLLGLAASALALWTCWGRGRFARALAVTAMVVVLAWGLWGVVASAGALGGVAGAASWILPPIPFADVPWLQVEVASGALRAGLALTVLTSLFWRRV